MAFFELVSGSAHQIKPLSVHPGNEKGAQGVIEANLGPIFGVRFVATEFRTGAKHRGRIDTLGLDEDGSPVILEYKRHTNENIINQGLFYLDWLLDHRGDFELVARGQIGPDIEVTWEAPRLILLAGGFSRYDQYAVNRIDERIELWTYTFYEGDYLRVEPLETEEVSTKTKISKAKPATASSRAVTYSMDHHITQMSESSREVFESLREQILALGDDVAERPMKKYIGYRRLKNFCEIVPKRSKLNVFIDGPVQNSKGIGEDYSSIGHWGTGDLRVEVATLEAIPATMEVVSEAYRLQD